MVNLWRDVVFGVDIVEFCLHGFFSVLESG